MSAASARRRYATPQGKFEQQRRQAKQRSIDWLLSFEEWFSIWQESGLWHLRGKRKGQYVMARRGDVGPYSRANVYICLASENHSHAHTNGRVLAGRIAAGRSVTPKVRKPRSVRGWTYVKGKFQVMCGRTYIGRFATQQDAEVAFANASAQREAQRQSIQHMNPGSGGGVVHAANSLAPQ